MDFDIFYLIYFSNGYASFKKTWNIKVYFYNPHRRVQIQKVIVKKPVKIIIIKTASSFIGERPECAQKTNELYFESRNDTLLSVVPTRFLFLLVFSISLSSAM